MIDFFLFPQQLSYVKIYPCFRGRENQDNILAALRVRVFVKERNEEKNFDSPVISCMYSYYVIYRAAKYPRYLLV